MEPTHPPAELEERRSYPCAGLIAHHCEVLEEHTATAHQHDELVRKSLFGPIDPTIDNPEHRAEKLGLVYQVGELYAQSQNGGIRTQIRKRDAALIAAVIAVLTELAAMLNRAI